MHRCAANLDSMECDALRTAVCAQNASRRDQRDKQSHHALEGHTHTYTQIQSDDALTRLVTMGYHVSPRCTFCNNSKGAIHANHASQTHESSSGHRHFARKQDITVYWRDYCQLCKTRHYTRCGGRKTTPSSSVNKHLYDKMLILGTRTADKRASCMTLGRMDVAACCFVVSPRRIHWHFTSLGTYH